MRCDQSNFKSSEHNYICRSSPIDNSAKGDLTKIWNFPMIPCEPKNLKHYQNWYLKALALQIKCKVSLKLQQAKSGFLALHITREQSYDQKARHSEVSNSASCFFYCSSITCPDSHKCQSEIFILIKVICSCSLTFLR